MKKNKKKRTVSYPTIEALQFLIKNGDEKENSASDENCVEDTIPDLPAVQAELEENDDKELKTLTDSFDGIRPPKTTRHLRFIQHSTDNVLDALLEEASNEKVPENPVNTILEEAESGEVKEVQVNDDELSMYFKFKEYKKAPKDKEDSGDGDGS